MGQVWVPAAYGTLGNPWQYTPPHLEYVPDPPVQGKPAYVVPIAGAHLVGPPNSQVWALSDGKFYVPASWFAGGGGIARMSDAQAAALGGRPTGSQLGATGANLGGLGYVFDSNPSGQVAAGQSGVSYTPGQGSDLKNTALSFAPLAGPFVALGISSLGVAASGTALSSGGVAAETTAAAATTVGEGSIGAAAGIDLSADIPPALSVSPVSVPVADVTEAGYIMPGADAAASSTGTLTAAESGNAISVSSLWTDAKAAIAGIATVKTAAALLTPKKAPQQQPAQSGLVHAVYIPPPSMQSSSTSTVVIVIVAIAATLLFAKFLFA